MKRTVSAVLAVFGMLLAACTNQMPVEDQLQGVLDRGISRYDIQGVSAAVIFPDGEIWKGASGRSHDTVPMAPGMVFAIGSVTKNIVSTLVLSLAEDGVLSLDDPLSRWLPAYAHVDGNITIRQLLNHTSGVYNYFDNQDIWDDLIADRRRYFTPEEVLAYLQEPYFAAGEGWRYSNTNYLLAAMIINQATGSNLSTELENRLYQPLGFSDFYLSQEQSLPAHQAHVYSDNWDGPIRDVTFLPRTSHESIGYGAGGIFTTAENLARWSQELFGGRILSQQSLEEMLQFVEFAPVSNMQAYGLGVQQYTNNISYGEHAIGHGGGNIGTTTYMVYLPDHQVSIVVMVNAFPNEGADAMTKGLVRAVLTELGAFGLASLIAANRPVVLIASLAAAFWAIYLTVLLIRKNRKKASRAS